MKIPYSGMGRPLLPGFSDKGTARKSKALYPMINLYFLQRNASSLSVGWMFTTIPGSV